MTAYRKLQFAIKSSNKEMCEKIGNVSKKILIKGKI